MEHRLRGIVAGISVTFRGMALILSKYFPVYQLEAHIAFRLEDDFSEGPLQQIFPCGMLFQQAF